MRATTNMRIPTHIPLQGACNARHLGGYPTPLGPTRDFSFIRCEAPTGLTGADLAALLKLGVRTVIDLRGPGEVERDPNPFATVPVVALHYNPIFSDDAALGAFDHMPRGASYCWMLDSFQAAYKTAFEHILRASNGVLFHCAAGKDRTGLLAALLLLLAGVDEETVAEEYAYSRVLLAPWVEKQNARTPERTPEELDRIHGVYPAYMLEAILHINAQYGGVERYLLAIGLTRVELYSLKRRMTGMVFQGGKSA